MTLPTFSAPLKPMLTCARFQMSQMSMGKKLRYMSNFAATFSMSDNTQLIGTQAIRNSLIARL